VLSKEEKLEKAMNAIGEALKEVTPEEKKILEWLRKQIDDVGEAAAEEDQNFDKRLEFCYGVITATDSIHNEKLLKACKNYIEAAEK